MRAFTGILTTVGMILLSALQTGAQLNGPSPARSDRPANRGFTLPGGTFDVPSPDEGGGDYVLAQGFRAAKITADQLVKIQPVMTEVRNATKSAQEAQTKANDDLRKAVQAASAAGAANPYDTPEVKAANEAINKLYTDSFAAQEKLRDKVVAALGNVVSAEQLATLRDNCDGSSMDPAKRDRVLARQWAKKYVAGVKLTEVQFDQIATQAAPIQEKFAPKVAELRKAQNDLRQHMAADDPKNGYAKADKIMAPKIRELNAAFAKALDEMIDSVLTDDQKKQAAAGRKKTFEDAAVYWADKTLNMFGAVKLTDEQSDKAMQIAAAAGEAMLKTEPYDQTARETLAEKARADIEKLLTDDQRAVLTKAMTDPRTTTLTDDGKMTEEQKSAAMEKAMAAGQVSTVQSQVDKDGKATMTITYAPLTFPPGPRPPGALRDSDRPPCTRR